MKQAPIDFAKWETLFEKKITEVATLDDPAHDLLHFRRVVQLAKKICLQEGGQLAVVVPAAWLHDLVIVPKDHPLRSQASRLSAEAAIQYLKEIGYPQEYHEDIAHAIAGHSFSADLEVKTLEAQIVQDADRLDGVGAIGIARCFAVAGMLKRSLYNAEDPFCDHRQTDDTQFTVDHFYKKLFRTVETLKTASGRFEGQRRSEQMRSYLSALRQEIDGH